MREIEILEMNFIPEKYEEFRSHKHFVLISQMKRNQNLKQGAKPYLGFKYKDEDIYLRKDLVVLRTSEQWRRIGRKIKPGETFLKKVKGNYNDKTKMARLFATWQTQKFENKLNPDGTIPQNEYGNLEVYRKADIPKGCAYMDCYQSIFICKKYEIEYRRAVTGFSIQGNGMSYPVVKGIVVHQKDVEKIKEISILRVEEKEKRDIVKAKRQAKVTWKLLIKRVCVKRYVSKLYDRDLQERAETLPMTFK
mmetsp:Transcript_25539/g.22694  ORF Transcript_25539/g.22694 Transcript_25539/m.22694 type:complete len:250 (+) Transcript_25539:727-1476(+)